MSSHILVNETEIILSLDKFTFLGLRDFHAHVLILKIGINTSSSLLANLYNTFPEITSNLLQTYIPLHLTFPIFDIE